jgi:glycine/serine hydroxymethyltransferase
MKPRKLKHTGRRFSGSNSYCPICHEDSVTDTGRTSFRGSRGRLVFTCTNPRCRAFTETAFWINGEEFTEEEYKAWVRYNQREAKKLGIPF